MAVFPLNKHRRLPRQTRTASVSRFALLPFALLLPLFLNAPLSLHAQAPGQAIPAPPGYDGADLDTVRAREEFRVGVQAYNRYSYNEAIRSFERALSYRPGEPLILDWLGKAYYHSGIENTAFRVWQAAAEGYGYTSGQGLLISSRMETLQNRRVLIPVNDDDVRYVESGRYPGRTGDNVYYQHPSAVLTLNDGSAWVVAFGSNEIVRIDPNGLIRERKRGPMNGFDRPYDLVKGPEGNLYLSELRGNRVSVLSPDGDWQYYIGSRGQGPGQFVGPQNLAVDGEGYLYVVDYGNKRVMKFDPSGDFILSFGARGAGGFSGFISPTGIVARGGRVYVADNLLKEIHTFDRNGVYLGALVREGLASPESLRLLDDGGILAVDSNRILLIDPDTAIIRELGLFRNPSRVRLTGAEMDVNGNVLVTDFDSGEVAVMTRIDDMASGLFVEITRVVADNFPRVTVEVEVTDRLRRPVAGLDPRNFLLSEGGQPVGEQNLLASAFRSANTDLAVLFERSDATLPLRDDFIAALRDIDAAGSIVSVIDAAEQPARVNTAAAAGNTPSQRLASAARGEPASHSANWRFDLGLRLAATDLLSGEKKRAVVFVGAGSFGQAGGQGNTLGDFEQYSLAELAAYLSNNNVVFYAVIADGLPPGGDVRYLCEQTGGQVLSLYRSEGVSGVIAGLAGKSSGYYILNYRSRLATDFGRAYLPVEAEVYLMERSGRDATGYFPPLE